MSQIILISQPLSCSGPKAKTSEGKYSSSLVPAMLANSSSAEKRLRLPSFATTRFSQKVSALKYMYSHTYDVVYYRYSALGFAHVVYAEYRVKQDQSGPTLEIIESFFEMTDTRRKEQFAEKIMVLKQKYPGEMVLDLRRVDL
ncbi:hypothetical protein SISNIDRAFT_491879 [Sistotremastrum niveocremeum HHB9708]|uniref:Uncharacterized protein n=1 Tax=Sistotremastrum niveocremeum HHB9708 TaxID=1314777 RepID=A0A164MAH3_9AGAM|nr:hypothetical protein SISNIDRAFT_491879 [Sistotremastrum niveocremeum HHB9708]